ncbi:N-methyl-L-tryptophan oxidase [Ancylobacter pratisalsi]|uniref:N-methyl-L-tryptophan oxidase n=1 Tax=Ancylobacter pratisalsi TaxID=1745854 RepID=A0A6P1YXH2_9HYPH|nr:N-methyl-L-tryptophan oxidase [Ancylobacter pratisalsi]QIB36264.1 N-methyl-L-tryptophan oxidase [Ancylobacter pratisalsi]
MERTQLAVVGLGAMGMATLYQLARRGIDVIGIDRFEPPHELGSSHGETRITRQAVGEGRDYVPFVLASHSIWRELEAASGETLLEECGALVIAPGSGVSSHHGKPDFAARSIEMARAFGIAHEVLDGAEARRRFPQLEGISSDDKIYYEPGGGYVRPERCIAVQRDQAQALGARLRLGAEVTSIRQEGDGVHISVGGDEIVADQVVVAAGAWTAPLLGPPFDRLLTVSRQVLHWFRLEDPVPHTGAPVFIWMHGAGDEDYFYGFPPLPGDDRFKVASEQYRATTTAETLDREVSPAESAEMWQAHVAGRVAGVTAEVAQAAACLYTVTPDNGFIIDRHPQQDRVMVVSACSGHGFKHSAGIGQAVAEAVLGLPSTFDLAPFSLTRFQVSST